MGWKWPVDVGLPACMEMDPVLEVQDDAVAAVAFQHLLLLQSVRHLLQSCLSIGRLLRSDCVSQEGLCPSHNRFVCLWDLSLYNELWEIELLLS